MVGATEDTCVDGLLSGVLEEVLDNPAAGGLCTIGDAGLLDVAEAVGLRFFGNGNTCTEEVSLTGDAEQIGLYAATGAFCTGAAEAGAWVPCGPDRATGEAG